jgi:beta-glucosidase-like glycosyl hydrolase
MGVHDYGLTTAYPAGSALAASWDVDLAWRFGASMGKDARARGVHFMLGPGMNIYRAPMNGRNFEYFGEDPISGIENGSLRRSLRVLVSRQLSADNRTYAYVLSCIEHVPQS